MIAAGVLSMLIAYMGGTLLNSVAFAVVAAIVFIARFAPAPRGSLMLNFTFGQTTFGTLGDSENPGGLRGYILWAPLCDITAHPALPIADNTTTDTQAVTLTGTYTMAATKVFKTLYGIDDKFKYKYQKVAEKGGAGFLITLECFFTGDNDALMAFLRRTNSVPGVFYCVTPEGIQYNIGTNAYPGWVTMMEGGTGEGGMKGLRGASITISAYSLAPVQKFAGVVPIT